MYVIKHLFHGYLRYITFITNKNDVIISLSNFTELLVLLLILAVEMIFIFDGFADGQINKISEDGGCHA